MSAKRAPMPKPTTIDGRGWPRDGGLRSFIAIKTWRIRCGGVIRWEDAQTNDASLWKANPHREREDAKATIDACGPHALCDASTNDTHVIHRSHEPVVSWNGDGFSCGGLPFLFCLEISVLCFYAWMILVGWFVSVHVKKMYHTPYISTFSTGERAGLTPVHFYLLSYRKHLHKDAVPLFFSHLDCHRLYSMCDSTKVSALLSWYTIQQYSTCTVCTVVCVMEDKKKCPIALIYEYSTVVVIHRYILLVH
jgi:hypothetical protein